MALFSANDYPLDALQRNEQGTVATRLQIDRDGIVSGCTVIRSSGYQSLDDTTCRILSQRARFTPARDSQGRPVPDSFDQQVAWRLQ